MLLLLGTEAQAIDDLKNVAQGVATLKLVFDLAEYLTDLVFDGVRA